VKKYVIYIFLPAIFLLHGCTPAPPQASLAHPADIRTKIEQSNARLVLVHVWATWCQPCCEEFPELIRVLRKYKTSTLLPILVSADDPADMEAVEAFLIEQGSPTGSLVAVDLSQTFIESLSANWSGAMPATFLYRSDGKLVAEWEGKRSYEHYITTIEKLLNQNHGGLK